MEENRGESRAAVARCHHADPELPILAAIAHRLIESAYNIHNLSPKQRSAVDDVLVDRGREISEPARCLGRKS